MISRIHSSFLQVKYTICSIRNTIAASGAMGDRVAADIKFNSFVNTKGQTGATCHMYDFHTSHVTRHTSHVTRHSSHVTRHTHRTGKPSTNKHCDLHVEHTNGLLKDGLKHVGGDLLVLLIRVEPVDNDR